MLVNCLVASLSAAGAADHKEKMTSPPGRISRGKKIALTEIRAGGGRMWELAEVLQWDT
jgi:hypothetical protein